MQNSLWEQSYAGQDNAGSCGRKTLLFVSKVSIDDIDIRACRRNILEAMAQLTLTLALNWGIELLNSEVDQA